MQQYSSKLRQISYSHRLKHTFSFQHLKNTHETQFSSEFRNNVSFSLKCLTEEKQTNKKLKRIFNFKNQLVHCLPSFQSAQ